MLRLDSAPPNPLVRSLFLRGVGIIYLFAFLSLALQMPGLYSAQGILPIADFIAARLTPGELEAILKAPTLFWLNTSDLFIQALPLVGAALAVALVLGAAHRFIRILLFVLYLSLVAAGQDFMQFQWDYLLLEVGFLAIFLDDSPLFTWLYRWLLFRLMFLSGLVKIASGDPTWRDLTALSYHFETQPLPNIVGWYAHHLPLPVHQLMTAATFFVELVVPFFIFAPRRLRFIAAGFIAALHVQIFFTGNYNFFNLLSILLCLLLLDDAAVKRVLPARFRARIELRATRAPSRPAYWIANVVGALLFVVSLTRVLALFGLSLPGVSPFAAATSPFGIVNNYGPFAVMTTSRPEIVVEGSNDGENWVEYGFKYKPGDVRRPPPWVEPHQPRLDWQMWFAALRVHTGDPRALLPPLRINPSIQFFLQNYRVEPWFVNFLVRLLEGSPAVLALLDYNPFPDAPPRYIRARLYDYRFTELGAPFATGEWWQRKERDIYLPALTLGDKQQTTTD